MKIAKQVKQQAKHLLDYIDQSPSPWHAVTNVKTVLDAKGYQELKENQSWQLSPQGKYYVIRDESSIMAFQVGSQAVADSGFRVIGAHTDSPGLRVKPHTAAPVQNLLRLGVEVYGGPILATFADRDLSLAGRVSVRDNKADHGIKSMLVDFAKPLVRIPNLAIHMNREVNEKGLKLERQKHLPLILSVIEDDLPPQNVFTELLAKKLSVKPDDILAFELNVYDTQKGNFFGMHEEFIASRQLDNLASCHASLQALLEAESNDHAHTNVMALFDHEEVGSLSAKGADSNFMPQTLERIAACLTDNPESAHQAIANSFFISADMAHAIHPNYLDYYDNDHAAKMNQGPVIKGNCNQRYSTNSMSEARFIKTCEQAQVPWQRYIHHTDLPCGSTIGPMTAAKLGMLAVDVSNPMWSMHSARESAGTLDHQYMIDAMTCFYQGK